MELRKCKQCGETKSTTCYRPYYGELKGLYKACKDCEKINARYKYLNRKTKALTESEEAEVAGIEELYALQRQAGLQPPRRRAEKDSSVFKLLEEQKARIQKQAEERKDLADEVPEELARWMIQSLQGETPEDLQDRMDVLWDKYRPIIRVDEDGPIYDERFTEYLNQIQSKIDEYEGEFYD